MGLSDRSALVGQRREERSQIRRAEVQHDWSIGPDGANVDVSLGNITGERCVDIQGEVNLRPRRVDVDSESARGHCGSRGARRRLLGLRSDWRAAPGRWRAA